MSVAGAEVLKEFLVGIGFRIDETSLKKFNEALGITNATVLKVGVAAVGMASAVAAATIKVAEQMEALYYASQAGKSSVQNLQAYGYAFSRIGLDGEAAKNAVLSVARAIRSNPGMVGFLNSLGVSTEGKDNMQVVVDLIGKLRDMPFPVAEQIAGQFGIDGDTLFKLIQGYDTLKGAADDYAARLKEAGVNSNKLAKDSTGLMNDLRSLGATLGITGQQLEQTFIAPVRKAIQWLDRFAQMMSRSQGVAAKGYSWEFLFGDTVGKFLREQFGGDKQDHDGATPSGGSSPIDPENGPSPLGLRNNNPGNLRKWGMAEQSGGFAKFPSALAGLSAMAQNLINYGKRGWNSIKSIVEHWAPAGDGNNVQGYISSLMKQTGFKADQQLDLSDPEVLKKLMPAIVNQEQGKDPFAANLYEAAINGRLRGTILGANTPDRSAAPAGSQVNVTQHNETTIHIDGSHDPRSTGREVESAMEEVNAEQLRNTRKVYQ